MDTERIEKVVRKVAPGRKISLGGILGIFFSLKKIIDLIAEIIQGMNLEGTGRTGETAKDIRAALADTR